MKESLMESKISKEYKFERETSRRRVDNSCTKSKVPLNILAQQDILTTRWFVFWFSHCSQLLLAFPTFSSAVWIFCCGESTGRLVLQICKQWVSHYSLSTRLHPRNNDFRGSTIRLVLVLVLFEDALRDSARERLILRVALYILRPYYFLHYILLPLEFLFGNSQKRLFDSLVVIPLLLDWLNGLLHLLSWPFRRISLVYDFL